MERSFGVILGAEGGSGEDFSRPRAVQYSKKACSVPRLPFQPLGILARAIEEGGDLLSVMR